ncbi:carbamate kinase [Candidatus Dojkabacteria bacterium]|nr:carbamate kinase [Candidatus Dojkabacteria bacterium]
MTKRYIIALGGNAIQNKGEEGTFKQQFHNVYKTMENIYDLLQNDSNEVVITHGNGPQVGSLLIQNEAAKDQVAPMPMFVCGAMSQGQIGFFIQQSIRNIFLKNNKKKEIATLVTQVEVSERDSAFENPTKPVGPFYSKDEADDLKTNTDYVIKEDAGRGFRRVVPSPNPVNIVELEFIQESLEAGNLVVCSGGGGIPVIKSEDGYSGIDAVIDKDRAASLMAHKVEADTLIILTAVDQVFLNFGETDEKAIDKMNVEEAQKYLNEDHFAEGSMKPKIEACIQFVSQGNNRKALVTSPKAFSEAIKMQNGTWIQE